MKHTFAFVWVLNAKEMPNKRAMLQMVKCTVFVNDHVQWTITNSYANLNITFIWLCFYGD